MAVAQQDELEQSHADEQAVVGLVEDDQPRVGVDVDRDFFVSRQRVHDDHLVLGSRHALGVQNVEPANLIVHRCVLEALLLEAQHVENVRLADRTFEVSGLLEGNAVARELGEELRRHAQVVRRDEHESRTVGGEQAHERVDRTTVLEVSDHRDREVRELAEFVLDRERIEQSLSRVFARAIARVDDRNSAHPRGKLSRTGFTVTQDDDVRVSGDHTDRIGERLALRDRRELARALRTDHASAQTVHGRFEGEPCACRGLVKEHGTDVPSETLAAVMLRHDPHLTRAIEDVRDHVLVELSDPNEVFQTLHDPSSLLLDRPEHSKTKNARQARE